MASRRTNWRPTYWLVSWTPSSRWAAVGLGTGDDDAPGPPRDDLALGRLGGRGERGRQRVARLEAGQLLRDPEILPFAQVRIDGDVTARVEERAANLEALVDEELHHAG